MNITIEKIVYPGKSLARIKGKVFFTDQGLPGEIVKIEIIKETKSYAQAKTIKIITTSPHRQQVRCKHYQVCSPYQCIDYSQQIEIKKQQLEEVISRQLKIERILPEFRQSPQIWGYRNKIKVKIIRIGTLPQLAYNLPETDDKFIFIDKCFLSPERTNLFMSEFKNLLRLKDFPAVSQLTIKENKENKLLICLDHEDFLNIKEFSLAFKNLIIQFELAGVVLINEKTYKRTIIHGDNFFKEIINGKQFFIGINSFFQINLEGLRLLFKDLQDNLTLDKNIVLADFYCGVGTFGVLLSEQVKQVIGVEIEPESFLFLEKNIEANDLNNFDLHLCDCNDTLELLLKKNIDIVIIDPPRKGAGRQVCTKLAESEVNTIVYISCDLATLTRDLKTLLSTYEIKNIYAYDFFPHTPHLETMVILKKKDV